MTDLISSSTTGHVFHANFGWKASVGKATHAPTFMQRNLLGRDLSVLQPENCRFYRFFYDHDRHLLEPSLAAFALESIC